MSNPLQDALDAVVANRTLNRSEVRAEIERQLMVLVTQPVTLETVQGVRNLLMVHHKQILNHSALQYWLQANKDAIIEVVHKERTGG